MSEARVAHGDPLHHRALRAAAALAAAAIIAASALLAASPAYAAGFTDGDFQFDSTSATEATVTGYTGAATSITIPSSATDGVNTYAVTAIGDTAFQSKSLTGVVIPDSVTFIGQSAFGMNSLVSVVIPDSVTSMDTAVFQFNSTLTSVTLGNSLTSIPGYTFWQSGLTSITIPSSVTSIGDQAFILSHLTSVDVPDSVTSIGEEAFALNATLTSLRLGKSVETIDHDAFASTGLTTVTLPSSVDSIGNRAFNSASLTSAVFQGGAPSTFTPRSAGNGSLGDHDVTVYYPSAHAADFTPSPWQGYVTAQGATLRFNLGGHGTALPSVTVIPGESASAPASPTAAGYTFRGWFTSATGSTPFDFDTALNGDATAYAQWTGSGLAATGSDPLPLLTAGGLLSLIGALILIVGARIGRTRTTSPPVA
jgi:uncharacterized repeat protein (TIGR02543 family)